MIQPELTPEEADRLAGRLLRLLRRRSWTRTRLCQNFGISRTTLYRLERSRFMTRRTAVKICSAVGWESERVLLTPAARRSTANDLFTPSALQAAARHCDKNTPVLNAQLLYAAAANLLLNLQSRGGHAVISGAERVLKSGALHVISYRPNGTPRAEVRFGIHGRRLIYILVDYPENAAMPPQGGSGDATEVGFGFCLEFLNQPVTSLKADRRETLEQKINRELKRHGK